MSTAQKTSRKSATDTGMSADERAAMKERSAELRAAGQRAKGAAKAEAELQDCLDKIAEMPDGDRALAERVHAIVTAAAPELAPKTWYGMPAYAKDGKWSCYFKPAAKFKMRYATLGFEDAANLDDGAIWPTVFAVDRIGEAEQKHDHRAGAEGRQLTAYSSSTMPVVAYTRWPVNVSPCGRLGPGGTGCRHPAAPG